MEAKMIMPIIFLVMLMGILYSSLVSSTAYCTDIDSTNTSLKSYVNYSTTAAVNSILAWDTCINTTTLSEKVCSGTALSSQSTFCQYNCMNGACISNEAWCYDVDGTDWNKKSYIFIQNETSGNDILWDWCVNATTQVDYGCTGININWTAHGCDYRCSDGLCIDEPAAGAQICTDTDGGLIYGTAGTVNISNSTTTISSAEDTCEDTDYLVEYYCFESNYYSYATYCQSGCLNGICVDYNFNNTNASIANLVIKSASHGNVTFNQNVTVYTAPEVIISFNSIRVTSSEFNVPATLVITNLTYSNPQILRDGATCSDCTKQSYSGGVLVFNVTGFSTYTTQETPVVGGGGGGGGSSSVTNTTTNTTQTVETITSPEPEKTSNKNIFIAVIVIAGVLYLISKYDKK